MKTKLCFFLSFLFVILTLDSYAQTPCIPTGTVTIFSAMPTMNFNGASLFVGDNVGGEWRSLMQFDLNSIPTCATVTNAYIRIYYYTGSTCTNPINIRLYRVTNSWNPNTVTWNNAPSWNSTSYGSWWPSYSGSYFDLPVTTLVIDWLLLGNNGMLLKKNSGTGCSEFFQLNSTYPPILYVTYTPGVNSTSPSGANANPSSVCLGNSSTLTVVGGSLGTGASWKWYSGSCGGTYVGTGNSITVSPSSTTIYYVRAEGTCNITSCANTIVTVMQLVGPATIIGPTSVCENSFSPELNQCHFLKQNRTT